MCDDLFSDILGSDSDLEEDLHRAELREDFEQHPSPTPMHNNTIPPANPSDAGGPSPLDMYALLNRKMDMLSKSEEGSRGGSRGGSRPRSPLIPPPSGGPPRIRIGLKVSVRLTVNTGDPAAAQPPAAQGVSAPHQTAQNSTDDVLDLLSDDVVMTPLPSTHPLAAPAPLVTIQLFVVEGLRGAEDDDGSPRSSICTEAPDVAGLHPSTRPPPEPSQKALAAMWELLEGCLGLVHPELEQQAQEALLMKIDAKLAENEATTGSVNSGGGGGGTQAATGVATPASSSSSKPANRYDVSLSHTNGVNGVHDDAHTVHDVGGGPPGTPLPVGQGNTPGGGGYGGGGYGSNSTNQHTAPDRQSSLMSTPSMVSDMEKRGLLEGGTPVSEVHSTPGVGADSGAGRGGEVSGGGAVGGDPGGGDVSVAMMPRYVLRCFDGVFCESICCFCTASVVHGFSHKRCTFVLCMVSHTMPSMPHTSHYMHRSPCTYATYACHMYMHPPPHHTLPSPFQPIRPRWYDARARIALKRLCQWLNVPWSRVQNFEMLLAYQVEAGEKMRPTVNVDNWTKSKRLATIAAIAVAGGGAFALVGALGGGCGRGRGVFVFLF